MNAMNQIAEARASALSLRASVKSCTHEQGALKFRLMRAAELLDAMVLLAVRGLDRIEQLEQQFAATSAGSGESAQTAAPGLPMPADMPVTPVIVGTVDVAPLALAARILHMVTDEMDETGAGELRASVRTARRIVQEVFDDLRATSAGRAS